MSAPVTLNEDHFVLVYALLPDLMTYSGPHVKDQKEGKESLGQGSRNEALFIHVARGYPSR